MASVVPLLIYVIAARGGSRARVGGCNRLNNFFSFSNFVCVVKKSSDHIHLWQTKRLICTSRQTKWPWGILDYENSGSLIQNYGKI